MRRRFAPFFLCAAAWTASAQTAVPPPAFPTKIEVTQRSEKGGETAAILEKVAWPATVLLLAFLFRKPIQQAFEQIGKQGGEISVAGLGIKLPSMQPTPLGDDVLAFQKGDPFVLTNDSAKSTLLRILQEPGFVDYLVIDLGEGDQWITSRLFIFAVMLQRIKRTRCLVFREGSVPRFLGTARPEHVRWALAKEQPWLEQAFVQTMNERAVARPDFTILNDEGAVPSQLAEDVIRGYVQKLGQPGPGTLPPGKQWAKFGATTERATWLSGKDVVRMLGHDLRADSIVASGDRRAEARALLGCTAPWVARVTATRELDSIIDRTAFLNEVGAKMLSRLEQQTSKAG